MLHSGGSVDQVRTLGWRPALWDVRVPFLDWQIICARLTRHVLMTLGFFVHGLCLCTRAREQVRAYVRHVREGQGALLLSSPTSFLQK